MILPLEFCDDVAQPFAGFGNFIFPLIENLFNFLRKNSRLINNIPHKIFAVPKH